MFEAATAHVVQNPLSSPRAYLRPTLTAHSFSLTQTAPAATMHTLGWQYRLGPEDTSKPVRG
jgi:hypothetical protein